MQFIPSRSVTRLGASLLAALLALGFGASAQAQWKWRDKNDRVQYSDVPPPNSIPDKDVLQRPPGARRAGPQFLPTETAAASAPAPALGGSAPPKTVDPELEARRKKAEQDEAAKHKAEEDKIKLARAENCARAKSHLAQLESGHRMARITATGEREVYDDKIRAEEAKRTREVMAADCAK